MVSLPFTDPVAAPAVRTPKLKISQKQSASDGLGGLADAAGALLGGNPGPDPWSTHLIGLRMSLSLGDHVGSVILHILESESAPEASLGDELELALGFDDETETPIFTGKIQRLENHLAGYRRLTITSPFLELSQKRINASFEEQSASDIVQSLLGETNVGAGSIDSGEQYSFYVVSDRLSLLQHIQAISAQQNWICYCGANGQLNAHALDTGEEAKVFAYGSDIIELEHWVQEAALTGVKVVGGGAATSQGSDAWNWLTKDPKALAEAGESGRVVPMRVLRDAPSAQNFSAALMSKDAQATNRVRLTSSAAPEVLPGTYFEITGAPFSAANAIFVAEKVVMTFDRSKGFLSFIEGFSRDSAGTSALGSLGGLL
ncbi:hypothetical protein [Hahella ganghwensis]|uniref:hypothetical protein n=1 Tax=Hahella ganghwensis TaxID=286420 RepID=UPI000366743A|nr:hypothetical protein [Hahella ganghwensis]